HGDDGLLKPLVADSGHGEQELAAEKSGLIHAPSLSTRRDGDNAPGPPSRRKGRIPGSKTQPGGVPPLRTGSADPKPRANVIWRGGAKTMSIKVGDRVPPVSFVKATPDGPQPVDSENFFKGR